MPPTAADAWQIHVDAGQKASEAALRAEHAGTFDVAYRLYIEAAQSYLWLIRNTDDSRKRDSLKAASAKILARAEKIKAVRRDVRASPIQHLAEHQQLAVLEASSRIGGHQYELWQGAQHAILARQNPAAGRHPAAASVYADKFAKELSILSPAATAVMIVQNDIKDCSVITALISCLHHHKRFQSRLGVDRLFPQDDSKWPCFSPSGQYCVKLTCNGADRVAAIDGTLPVDDNGRLTCSSMTNGDLWTALMEKAYLELLGGYNVSGSNPSADTYAYTGWVPEDIDISATDFRPHQAWARLSESFAKGECVLSVGTHREVTLGNAVFAQKHAFAVMSLDLLDGLPAAKVMNPWQTSSSMDNEDVNRCQTLLWTDLCNNFSSIHCNWRPDLWPCQEHVHFNAALHDSVDFDVQLAPSTSLSGDVVDFMLSRHITGITEPDEYMALAVQELHALSMASVRILCSQQTSFTNAVHLNLRYAAKKPQPLLRISILRKGRHITMAASVKVLSHAPLTISETAKTCTRTSQIVGNWRGTSAGGNQSLPSFVNNPQYHFKIAEPGCELRITLEADADMLVGLKLFSAPIAQARILQFETAVLKADANNGVLRRGGVLIHLSRLSSGDYVVVPYTHEHGTEGAFKLQLRSNVDVKPVLLPAEDAGMYIKVIKGKWQDSTAAGGPSHGRYSFNPQYRFRCSKRGTFRARLRVTSHPDLPVNATLFEVSAAGSLGVQVGTSGPYAAFIAGCTIPEIALSESRLGYALVVSSWQPNIHVDFELTLLSTMTLDMLS